VMIWIHRRSVFVEMNGSAALRPIARVRSPLRVWGSSRIDRTAQARCSRLAGWYPRRW